MSAISLAEQDNPRESLTPDSYSPIFEDLSLPKGLEGLRSLVVNMYWTWDTKTRRVFERIDKKSWDMLNQNPLMLLRKVDQKRLDEIATDATFLSELAEALERQKRYLSKRTWFESTHSSQNHRVIAYFSAEFGFAECFKMYSGGLGILSGDHLKSASDLGLPLVGVGLFYNRGYFSQSIDESGWQVESYPENIPNDLPCTPVLSKSNERLTVRVPIGSRKVRIRAWKISVGRIPLYLLDSNLPEFNSREDCEITASLYGGDSETRIKQELVLGFGGTRLLSSLGISPSVYHMNEGHAAFATLERIRQIMEESRVSFSEAKLRAKEGNVFTTHTPVPAGIDVFEPGRIADYLSWYCDETGLSVEDLLDLGRDGGYGFNMAVLAIKLSRNINAVSKLHREVAQRIWSGLFAEHKENARIDCVTNGIHIPSWISDEMAELYQKHFGADWAENTYSEEMWSRVEDIPDELLWQVRSDSRAKLVEFIRNKFSLPGFRFAKESILNEQALTIGFSRRFATYKRANLILRNRERLQRLLGNEDRPVQFVFSGKAHPRDHEAKLIIQEIVNYSKSDSSRCRVIFLQEYDIALAKKLMSGVDVWLNNPRRPQEACGTSGMKTLANGALNLSVLDGWWAEAYSPELGWEVGDGTELWDHREQDEKDAESLYNALETRVIPEFYDREGGIPKKWVQKMKKSISSLSPRFSTRRMVMEYSSKFYLTDEPGHSETSATPRTV